MSVRSPGSWKYVPEDWAARERFIYRSASALLRLGFEWELEKSPRPDGAIVRARASVNIPFRREQRLVWEARFPSHSDGPFGFDFVGETNEATGSTRTWSVQSDRLVYNEGKVERIIEAPAGTIVFHPLQIPAFFRSLGAAPPAEPLTLLVSRRFQALRATNSGVVGSDRRVRLEAAVFSERGVDWSEARSGEVLLEPSSGSVREIRAHVPVLGSVSVQLEKHEI